MHLTPLDWYAREDFVATIDPAATGTTPKTLPVNGDYPFYNLKMSCQMSLTGYAAGDPDKTFGALNATAGAFVLKLGFIDDCSAAGKKLEVTITKTAG